MKQHQIRLLFDSLLLGAVGALSAQLFNWMLHWCQYFLLSGIAGYRPPGLPDEGGALNQSLGPHGLWLVPLSLILGGLLSGMLVYFFAPETEGHGTDTAVKAFHQDKGFIRFRVPPIKMIASAITIGSGGSAGREGPTALITAGIGSTYAGLIHRTEAERRTLVLVGMAAGLSAMFRSPIGTALFAVEVLYSDMELEAPVLLFTMLASITAYSINGLFVSWQPLFRVPATFTFAATADYGWYLVLGLLSGAAASLLPWLFYATRDLFLRFPIPLFLKPALGGFCTGVIALFLPEVMGGGYGWIQEAINGHFGAWLLAALFLGKAFAFCLTVSSGGSGGVFAPTLYLGAMLGGLLACLAHQPTAAFVVVGMAAVFGAAARVPIATLLMVMEMTGGFDLLVPACFAVVVSVLVQVALTRSFRYQTLYQAQIPHRPAVGALAEG